VNFTLSASPLGAQEEEEEEVEEAPEPLTGRYRLLFYEVQRRLAVRPARASKGGRPVRMNSDGPSTGPPARRHRPTRTALAQAGSWAAA
jgi:hypothetical protein